MTIRERLRGVFTALVTPFHDDGTLDAVAFRRLVERQLDSGVHGLVPCGTTGETPALDREEWETLIRIAVEASGGRVPVVPGTGTNDTRASIERTVRARELGADAALVVTPYYNKPNTEGLAGHFEAVAAEGGLPVVVYNVPSRTGRNIRPAELKRLAAIEGVVAVKEAAGDMAQAQEILASRPARLAVLSGEDALTCAMTLMGGDGVISVVSNVDPAGTVKMVQACLSGDVAAAREAHYRLLPLMDALFAETNPVPAKAAVHLLGLAGAHVRLPLARASRETIARVADTMAGLGLTKA